MTIDWEHFTLLPSLLGGLLIGLGSSILAIFNGRIAGISGILGQLLNVANAPKEHFAWRILFILGLLLAPIFYQMAMPLPMVNISTNETGIVIAGFIVGFGTRMGSGCTSGHGVCGLGRLSLRSLFATLSFMSAGFIATYIFLHAIG